MKGQNQLAVGTHREGPVPRTWSLDRARVFPGLGVPRRDRGKVGPCKEEEYREKGVLGGTGIP